MAGYIKRLVILCCVVFPQSPAAIYDRYEIDSWAELIHVTLPTFQARCAAMVIDLEHIFSSTVGVTQLIHLVKSLSSRGVAVTFMSMQTLNVSAEMFHCHHSRTLFVVPPSWSKEEILLRQMREKNPQQRKARIFTVGQITSKQPISTSRWLVIRRSGRKTIPLEEFFEGVDLPFNSNVVVAETSNTTRAGNLSLPRDKAYDFSLTDVYRVTPTGHLQASPRSHWKKEGGALDIPDVTSFYEKRWDLSGLQLTATLHHQPPITLVNVHMNGEVTFGGYFGEIWKTLEDKMNFTTKYMVHDETHGKHDGNIHRVSHPEVHGDDQHANNPGDHDDDHDKHHMQMMIRMLISKEVDVVISGITMHTDYLQDIEFATPLITTKACVFMRNQDDVTNDWDNYLEPFFPSLWLAIGVVTVLGIFCLVFIKVLRMHRMQDEVWDQLTWKDFTFYMISIVCQQGIDRFPMSTAYRIVLVTSHLLYVVIVSSYCAAIISTLAVLDYELPFQTFLDLLGDDSVQIGVSSDTSIHDDLCGSLDPVISLLCSKMRTDHKKDTPKSTKEGLQMVCSQENYAFIALTDFAEVLAGDLPCDVVYLPRACFRHSVVFALRKDSPYAGLIDYNLRKMHNNGVLSKLHRDAWPRRALNSVNAVQGISLESIQSLFLILTLGALASVVILASEKLYQKLASPGDNKKRYSRKIYPNVMGQRVDYLD